MRISSMSLPPKWKRSSKNRKSWKKNLPRKKTIPRKGRGRCEIKRKWSIPMRTSRKNSLARWRKYRKTFQSWLSRKDWTCSSAKIPWTGKKGSMKKRRKMGRTSRLCSKWWWRRRWRPKNQQKATSSCTKSSARQGLTRQRESGPSTRLSIKDRAPLCSSNDMQVDSASITKPSDKTTDRFFSVKTSEAALAATTTSVSLNRWKKITPPTSEN